MQPDKLSISTKHIVIFVTVIYMTWLLKIAFAHIVWYNALLIVQSATTTEPEIEMTSGFGSTVGMLSQLHR